MQRFNGLMTETRSNIIIIIIIFVHDAFIDH